MKNANPLKPIVDYTDSLETANDTLTQQVNDLQVALTAAKGTIDHLQSLPPATPAWEKPPATPAWEKPPATPAWEKVADQIIAAGQALGKFNIPYHFGGDNFAEGGLDCSGFTKLLYDLFAGTDLPRISGNQSQAGVAVAYTDIRKGDALFFTYDQRNNGLPTHVGIYVGGGRMIHTNNDQERIHISTVNISSVTCVRRFIKDQG